MALSGLDIYKLLPKTNCKECGFPTCLAFAMQLSQKKVSLDACPHVSASSRAALESAAQPPIKLVTLRGEKRSLEVGNETVMFRHEQTFHHPAGVGVLLDDTLVGAGLERAIADIAGLKFARVGQEFSIDCVAVEQKAADPGAFADVVKRLASETGLPLILIAADAAILKKGIEAVKGQRPLIMGRSEARFDELCQVAKECAVPLVINARTLDEAAELTVKAKAAGVEELVLSLDDLGGIAESIQKRTYARRSALKKNLRALGYPTIVLVDREDEGGALQEAITAVLRYGSIVLARQRSKEFILPLLVARQDIYTDPQKPVQVEPKIYEIGRVGPDSPLLVTTNFSITYFTVAGEVESSKVPAYILACDADGMSVLTAWAAEKFTAETITAMIARTGIGNTINHKSMVIPGYAAVLSGRLEALSGWKVTVGPRESSGIPSFLKGAR